MCFEIGKYIRLMISTSQEEIQMQLQLFLKKKSTQLQVYLNFEKIETVVQVDTIFINGSIYTMDQALPKVQAVAVKDGIIVDAGNYIQLTKLKGENTKIIDLQGKTMLPGFIQPHVHFTAAFTEKWVDLGPFQNKNTQEIWQKLKNQIQSANKRKKKQNEWIICKLYDPLITPGNPLDVSKQSLDKLSDSIPIVIIQANGHIAHANSQAFKKSGITKETEDPQHGHIVKDENGDLTGEVQEVTAIGMLLKQAPKVTLKQYLAGALKFFKKASSLGCTSIHDCGIGVISPKIDYLAVTSALAKDPPIRFSGYLSSEYWDQWMNMGLTPENINPYIRINGMKCWCDGSIQGGTAFLRDQYIKKQWNIGKPNYTQQQLNEIVLKCHKNGWQVGIHANGDAAIDMCLVAYKQTSLFPTKKKLRHRIQHATICRPQHLEKMAELDVSPSFLIGHIYYYGEVFKNQLIGQERTNMVDPLKSALSLGIRPTIHSDYQCQPLNPIRCISNAVNRKTKETKEVINEDECINILDALKMMTIDAAWQCHMQDIIGSISRGKYADFVILDKDPFQISKQEIINLKVEETWMNGQIKYQRLKNLDEQIIE